MSTLSKLFVVLVFVVALVKLGVDATLFSMRTDFKDKFVKEVNYHYQTQQIKAAEIADLGAHIDSLKSYTDILKTKVDALDTERATLASQLAVSRRDLETKQTEVDRLTRGLDTFVRQLEVQLQQIQDAMVKVDEYRTRLAKANSEKLTAVQDLQYQRQDAERLSKDLAALEENHQAIAREKQRLQETIAHLSAMGVRTDVVGPRKILSGKVNAVLNQIDLVIISIGRDAGVNEGDEFTVYRGSNFVAKITIDRADRAWSSGRVDLKRDEPRVADDVTNNTLVAPAKSGN
jgi:predicted RNase H-like nuclease (RuvC/YqgF family)